MKRNNLTTALIAGIAGVAGIASVSTAVNLNDDGVGQVLIYPYYTVNNGLNTLLSVVNTTEDVKAVKVRFLEGKNSRECLDFNLYLSPYDVWTAQLKSVASSIAGHIGEDSVLLQTTDTSCIAPNRVSLPAGQEFLPYGYEINYDGVGLDLERCTEGHFEIIEMGTVINTTTNGAGSGAAYIGAASAVTHVGGTPRNCGVVDGNWSAGGAWNVDNHDGIVDPNGSGGLFGSTSLISVADGVSMTYNADAIQSFTLARNHTDPGSLVPNLKTGTEQQSIVFYNGVAVTTDWTTSSVEAVSALYMHNNVYVQYEVNSAFGALTEMVATFPTKFAYVDVFNAIGPVPFTPFTKFVDPVPPSSGAAHPQYGIGACEPFAVTGLYDREETTPDTPVGQIPVSPTPPGVDPTVPVFCWEANVLEFNFETAATGVSGILGSNNTTHLPSPFNSGWVSIAFAQSTNNNATVTTYTGLPITGFAAQKYTNGALAGGTLANYAGLFDNRYSKDIQ